MDLQPQRSGARDYDDLDFEAEAERLHEAAAGAVVCVTDLAAALGFALITEARYDGLIPGGMAPALRQIWHRPGLSEEEGVETTAWCLACWHLRRIGYRPSVAQALAPRLGPAIAAPRVAFLEAWRRRSNVALGADVAQVARELRVRRATVSLRLAETTGRPVAVVTPRRVVRRGEWSTLDAQRDLRRIVPRGFERAEIEPSRVALFGPG